MSPNIMTSPHLQLFKNGRIFSSAPDDNTLHEALLVEGDKVLFVGEEEDARKMIKDREPTETDLKGSVVLPGLIDAHTHLVMFGGSLLRFDCLGRTVSDIQQLVREARKANPNAEMLLGRSFLFDALGQPPHYSLLDAAVDDIPVFIDAADLHSSWLNGAAMRAVGITEDSPDPKGGQFVRDKEGKLTGLCLETAATSVAWPWIFARTKMEQRLQYLDSVFESYLATGVTGAIDMAMTAHDLEPLEVYYQRQGGRLPIRIDAHWVAMPQGTDEERKQFVLDAVEHRKRLKDHAPWLNIVGIKIVMDGSVDGCTAHLSKPYADGTVANPIWPIEELRPIIVLADSHDLQVAVHAIGDQASSDALDCFETAVQINGPRPSRRHRIEHLEVVSPESIERLTRLGIVASLQPVHADPVYASNWWKVLGNDERCDRAFPWSEFVDAGSHIAFGSDAPTAPHHPLPNLYTATTRRSAVDPTLGEPTDPRIQALDRFNFDLETSIRAYTMGGAYSSHKEGRWGSLEKGKQADFCVLDIDPFRDGVKTLREAQERVKETWINGQRSWARGGGIA